MPIAEGNDDRWGAYLHGVKKNLPESVSVVVSAVSNEVRTLNVLAVSA